MSCIACGERERWCRGLCGRCYRRHQKLGDLNEVALPNDQDWRKAGKGRAREIGSKLTRKDGYVAVATENGVIAEHKLVMEQMLGRPLAEGESVHHKNLCRDDNRPENLELWFRQPAGARVSDLIDYLVAYHAPALRNRLEMELPDLRVIR